MKPIDVGALVDESPFSRFQRAVVAATSLMIVLDGLDGQLLGNAVPAMMRDWNLPRSAFATVSAAAPFGMMIGGILGGVLSDRLGRRVALLGSVLTFALLTLAVAAVDSLAMLTLTRFLSGIGLGGAMPNATALVAEYAPRRQRPLAITLTIVCIPVGGFLGGLLAGQIVPVFGWRTLFVIGGLLPVAVAVALYRLLPESPRYLVRRRGRWRELSGIVRRMGHQVPADAEFVDIESSGATQARASVWALFGADLRRDASALMVAFASCLLAIWMGFLWIPALLTDTAVGFAQNDASYALSLFNFGGVGGALAGALIVQRIGSRPALFGMAGLSVAATALMAVAPPRVDAWLTSMMMFTVTGALLNAVQCTMYAVAAHVFPTEIRGTGVGATVAVGRVGNVLASYVGSAALTAGGPPLFFATTAAAMTVVFACMAILRRHIPPSPA